MREETREKIELNKSHRRRKLRVFQTVTPDGNTKGDLVKRLGGKRRGNEGRKERHHLGLEDKHDTSSKVKGKCFYHHIGHLCL